jgi:hypothetical protein
VGALEALFLNAALYCMHYSYNVLNIFIAWYWGKYVQYWLKIVIHALHKDICHFNFIFPYLQPNREFFLYKCKTYTGQLRMCFLHPKTMAEYRVYLKTSNMRKATIIAYSLYAHDFDDTKVSKHHITRGAVSRFNCSLFLFLWK